MTELQNLWKSLMEMFRSVEFSPINDVVDILLVTIIIYYTFKFLRDRRAGKLAAGVMLFLIFLIISDMLKMRALNFLLRAITNAGLVALLIVFQPELRSMLEKMGTGSIKNIRGMFSATSVRDIVGSITEICKAAESFSASKTGALIVLERETKLGDVIKTGTVMDAEVSCALIGNIFHVKAPLHDGELLIRNNRLFAAGCFLPLSQDSDIIRELGTRHRAAIGISEVSDAVVIVVSEETGIISVARNGRLERGLSVTAFEKLLIETLLSDGGAKLSKRFGREGDLDEK